MGNPAIYYYPDPAGSLEVIDLGEGLSNLDETPGIVASDGVAMDGTPYRAMNGPAHTVRIVLERFGTPGAVSLERKLQQLLNHLRRGGLCGVSRDHARSWAGRRAGTWSRGDAYVATYGPEFTAWSASATISSGDEVAIEQPPPWSTYEVRLSSGLTSGTRVDFSSETLAASASSGSGGWVRWRDFWPVCYLPASELGPGRNPITHDRRRNYTLDLPLVYAPSLMGVLLSSIRPDARPSPLVGAGRGAGATIKTGLLRGTAAAHNSGAGRTLEQLLGGMRSALATRLAGAR